VPYVPPFPGRSELMTLAMLEHAAERGVHDMSIRSLAAAVRAAPGSLTYHYRTKDDVLATCARFLGFWLYRDLGDRWADRGLASLLPDPAADAGHEDVEYARRWRVWIQLSAYALSSPAVAAPVHAGEERMTHALDDGCRRPATCARALFLWSSLKSLATAVLYPEVAVDRAAATAALVQVATHATSGTAGDEP
jgi:AcrR family transcriptional regulator